jgi:hypothetical protein
MPSGMGYGAQAGLQDVLKRLFLEAQQKQQADLAQAKLDEEIRQANMGNEIQQGQLGQGQQRIDLGRDELGLSREKFGEDTRRYDAEAPSREADVAYKGALTGELIRKPEAEQQDREFTTGRDQTLHGYRLGEINTSGANQRAVATIQGQNRGQLTGSQRVTASRGLMKDYQAATKPARELERQLTIMEQGLDAAKRGDMNAGSQAVLITFQKILDPTSVVRESEYARSQQGLSVLGQIQGLVPRLAQGGPGVPVQELEKFANLARQITAAMKQEAATKTADYRAIAEANGLDLSFGEGDATPAPAPAPGAKPSAQDLINKYRKQP